MAGAALGQPVLLNEADFIIRVFIESHRQGSDLDRADFDRGKDVLFNLPQNGARKIALRFEDTPTGLSKPSVDTGVEFTDENGGGMRLRTRQ